LYPLLSVAQNADGRLQVFAAGAYGPVYVERNLNTPTMWDPMIGLGYAGYVCNDYFNYCWSPYQVFAPAANLNGDGRLWAFAFGSDTSLWFASQSVPGGLFPPVPKGGKWYEYGTPGGVAVGAGGAGSKFPPFTGRNADGSLEVFAIGMSGDLWHIWQQGPAGNWSGWTSIGH
jgi:hypothetical protein